MDKYCIKDGYVANIENKTLETDGVVFWTPKRCQDSYFYQWHVYQYAKDIIKAKGLKRIIDVGCGAGTKMVRMLVPIADVIGIDQASVVDFCSNKYPGVNFMSDNFEEPTLNLDEAVDLVICSDVIEHLSDPDMLINYIKRFCGPDTIVVFSTPDRDKVRGIECSHSPKREHIREWSSPEFSQYLQSRGFTINEHLHLPPVKTHFNSLFFIHLIIQMFKLRSYRYNQVVSCSLK